MEWVEEEEEATDLIDRDERVCFFSLSKAS